MKIVVLILQEVMLQPFSYETSYILDKSHFKETYEESATVPHPVQAYRLTVLLVIVGCVILMLPEVSDYLGWFTIAIGAIEAVSVRFRKGWWITSQMFSRAANNTVALTVTETQITIRSPSVTQSISWDQVSHLTATNRGWLLHHNGGRTYLSNRCLSESVINFLHALAQSKNKKS
ncbi:YcxB family protein [Alteromonas ponticola]|uniref:YcxB family protein n=1 Tax=Alteromonas aquimaris TaxID=2998417 RepID=A0ABT3P336_9ALTE|nr:YcxB family protein [Alteromonas aquimaris]MCW8107170.1 YcxB family protein [Alteromonas aquimaris]